MAKKRPQGSMGRGVGAANGLLRTTFGRRLLARLAPVHPRGQVVLPEIFGELPNLPSCGRQWLQ